MSDELCCPNGLVRLDGAGGEKPIFELIDGLNAWRARTRGAWYSFTTGRPKAMQRICNMCRYSVRRLQGGLQSV